MMGVVAAWFSLRIDFNLNLDVNDFRLRLIIINYVVFRSSNEYQMREIFRFSSNATSSGFIADEMQLCVRRQVGFGNCK